MSVWKAPAAPAKPLLAAAPADRLHAVLTAGLQQRANTAKAAGATGAALLQELSALALDTDAPIRRGKATSNATEANAKRYLRATLPDLISNGNVRIAYAPQRVELRFYGEGYYSNTVGLIRTPANEEARAELTRQLDEVYSVLATLDWKAVDFGEPVLYVRLNDRETARAAQLWMKEEYPTSFWASINYARLVDQRAPAPLVPDWLLQNSSSPNTQARDSSPPPDDVESEALDSASESGANAPYNPAFGYDQQDHNNREAERSRIYNKVTGVIYLNYLIRIAGVRLAEDPTRDILTEVQKVLIYEFLKERMENKTIDLETRRLVRAVNASRIKPRTVERLRLVGSNVDKEPEDLDNDNLLVGVQQLLYTHWYSGVFAIENFYRESRAPGGDGWEANLLQRARALELYSVQKLITIPVLGRVTITVTMPPNKVKTRKRDDHKLLFKYNSNFKDKRIRDFGKMGLREAGMEYNTIDNQPSQLARINRFLNGVWKGLGSQERQEISSTDWDALAAQADTEPWVVSNQTIRETLQPAAAAGPSSPSLALADEQSAEAAEEEELFGLEP